MIVLGSAPSEINLVDFGGDLVNIKTKGEY